MWIWSIAAATISPSATVPGYATDAVAELVFGLALQLLRNLPACDQAARSGESSAGLRGQELAGKTFGIIGFGALGSRVATIAQAFGCHVLAYSRTPKGCAWGSLYRS